MNRDRLLELLPRLADRLICLEETGSTIDAARALASRGLDRPVVTADRQTGGRGRMGRPFLSPPGDGLYLSMALPLPRGALPPTVRAACGVHRALSAAAGRPLGIKWVNDLLLDGYKVVGILAEASGPAVVVGIGVNVNNPEGAFGPALPHVSSLAARCKRTFPLEEIAARVIAEVDAAWDATGEPALLTYYKENLVTLGRAVRVLDGSRERAGEAVGLDAEGGLLVRFEDSGAVETVVCGDVSVRGIQGYL